MIDDARRCTAKSKQSGERCKRPAAAGKRVCYMHGAKAGPPKGNLNALIHGIYVSRVVNDEEQRIYDAFLAEIREDFALNDPSDEIAVQMAAMAFVQFARAFKAGDAKAAETFERIVRNNLKDLKATKIAREGEGQEIKTTPADWATALLEKVREAGKQPGRKARKKRKKAADARRTPEKPQI